MKTIERFKVTYAGRLESLRTNKPDYVLAWVSRDRSPLSD